MYTVIYKNECFTRYFDESPRRRDGEHIRWEHKEFGGGSTWIGTGNSDIKNKCETRYSCMNSSFMSWKGKEFQYHLLEEQFLKTLSKYIREQKLKRIM